MKVDNMSPSVGHGVFVRNTCLHFVRSSTLPPRNTQILSSACSRGVTRPLMLDKDVLGDICLHAKTLKSSLDLRKVSIATEYFYVESGKILEKWFPEFFTILMVSLGHGGDGVWELQRRVPLSTAVLPWMSRARVVVGSSLVRSQRHCSRSPPLSRTARRCRSSLCVL